MVYYNASSSFSIFNVFAAIKIENQNICMDEKRQITSQKIIKKKIKSIINILYSEWC